MVYIAGWGVRSDGGLGRRLYVPILATGLHILV